MDYLLMYADYAETPRLESECILNNLDLALSEPKVCDVVLVTDNPVYGEKYIERQELHVISAAAFCNYVKEKLVSEGMDESLWACLKPYHLADYLAYFSREVAQRFLEDSDPRVLKVDADMFLTSKFVLREMFKTERNLFVGLDEGFMLRYLTENQRLPNHFYNVHMTFRGGDEEIVSHKLFIEYLIDSVYHHHYTATGPSLLNDAYAYPSSQMHLRGLMPWTLNPGKVRTLPISKLISDRGSVLKVPVRTGALGLHLQSSVLRSLGVTDADIEYSDYIDELLVKFESRTGGTEVNATVSE